MKKSLFLTLAILLAVFAVPAAAVNEATLEIQVPPEMTNSISVCSSTLLSSNDINIYLTNLGSETKIYSITANVPEPLSGFVKPFSDALAPGERYFVDPVWVTIPHDITPGKYNVEFIAKFPASGTPKEEISEVLEVNVLQCHSVEINIPERFKETCFEEPTIVKYDVEVTNNGRFTSTFVLEALTNGKRVDYARFSEESISLAPGASKTVVLELNPRGISQGAQKIDVVVKERNLLSQNSEAIELNVRNCYDFAANLIPSEAPACLGKTVKFDVVLVNKGIMDDTYLLNAPDYIDLSSESVIVSAGETFTVEAEAKPLRVGKLEFEVLVSSSTDADASITLKGVVNTDECRGVAVIGNPSQLKTCKNETVSFTFSVKNIGANKDAFDISANKGTLSTRKVELGPDAINEVELSINTKNMVGDNVITVTASNPGATDDASVSLIVESCYSASVDITPEVVETCPGEPVVFNVKLVNTGKKDDDYSVVFKDSRRTVSLDPGQSMEFEFTTSYGTEGTHDLVASVTSPKTSASDKSSIIIKPISECYGVKVRDGNRTEIKVDKAIAVPIYVKNTGETDDVYDISIQGPPWVYLSPKRVELKSGEESSVFMYISPPFGTKQGKYVLTVTAKSEFGTDKFTMDIIVGERISVVEPVLPTENVTEPEEPTENVTEPNETKGVEFNVSFGDTGETPDITGETIQEPEERPLWKTAVVAAITIIIIIILIVRFAFLIKK